MVERRSPKPEVVGSSPPLLPKREKVMINPLKFFRKLSRKLLELLGPLKKETMMGAVMVFALASIAAIFFLILDQLLIFTNLVLTISF